VRWTNIDNELADGLRARPGYYESFDSSQYPPDVRRALGQHLQPSEHEHAVPRTCVEFKPAQ
jgi:hypothetical protein